LRERHEEKGRGGFEVSEKGGENSLKQQSKDLTLDFAIGF
jgi:hypothetical protein